MKKIAICKSNTLYPNFILNKVYYYEYGDTLNDYYKNCYCVIDEFSIPFRFDKKWQNQFQDFFNFKPKNILFDAMFYDIAESRRIKLKKISEL